MEDFELPHRQTHFLAPAVGSLAPSPFAFVAEFTGLLFLVTSHCTLVVSDICLFCFCLATMAAASLLHPIPFPKTQHALFSYHPAAPPGLPTIRQPFSRSPYLLILPTIVSLILLALAARPSAFLPVCCWTCSACQHESEDARSCMAFHSPPPLPC